MPRFHFNMTDGGVHPDTVGQDLPTVQQARVDAVRLFGRFLQSDPESFWTDRGAQVQVTDDQGLILFTLDLSVNIAPALLSDRASKPQIIDAG